MDSNYLSSMLLTAIRELATLVATRKRIVYLLRKLCLSDLLSVTIDIFRFQQGSSSELAWNGVRELWSRCS